MKTASYFLAFFVLLSILVYAWAGETKMTIHYLDLGVSIDDNGRSLHDAHVHAVEVDNCLYEVYTWWDTTYYKLIKCQ